MDVLDDEDEDVFVINILDWYLIRLNFLKDVCFVEFGMWYDIDKSRRDN